MEINLHRILRDRLPSKVSRFVPGFLISLLERVIHQDELNDMLRVGFPLEGSGFARKVIEHLGIEIEVEGLDRIDGARPLMFAGNHPLGGLDGIALISILGEKFGDDHIRFIVNDMLMNVKPLSKVFLPVNKYGSQGRHSATAINDALTAGMHIFQFPAGLVSRLGDNGEIADLKWQKAFVAKALEYGRDIVPVRFEALNRKRFYRLARWRKKSGLKFNIEQAFLPAEVFAARNKRFRIIFGTPIPVETLSESGKSPSQIASEIRNTVYML